MKFTDITIGGGSDMIHHKQKREYVTSAVLGTIKMDTRMFCEYDFSLLSPNVRRDGYIEIERQIYPVDILPYLRPDVRVENMTDNSYLGRRGYNRFRCTFSDFVIDIV